MWRSGPEPRLLTWILRVWEGFNEPIGRPNIRDQSFSPVSINGFLAGFAFDALFKYGRGGVGLDMGEK